MSPAQRDDSSRPAQGMLTGIRVLDFCHFLAGPYATMVLADLGADVIKVEDPDRPDEARAIGPHFHHGQSLYFAALNWGKRSFCARLRTESGRAAVLDLVRSADVVVDNFRPGVMGKLGLDHEAVHAVNPRAVTCSLTGFGETGPYAGRAGYDYTVQALSGVMSMTGDPGTPPGKAGISYVDHSGGLAAAMAVCAALVERTNLGRGRHLDLSLFDVQMSMLTYLASWNLNAGVQPVRTENGAHPSLVPAQTFATSDGHISLFVGNDPMWTRLVDALGDAELARPELARGAERYAQRTAVLARLSEIFARHSAEHWVDLLAAAGVPCAPCNALGEALADPQVRARGLISTARHPEYPEYQHVRGPVPADAAVARGAPLLGEHTTELLNELGYSQDAVAELVDAIPARR